MVFKIGQLIKLGILLIVIGFIIVFFGMFMGAKENSSKTKVAVGGFIGPIPFGFGNDKRLLWFVAMVSVALLVFWLIFSFRLV
ncbi:DUF131 domain-containing protein [Candidatus Woesearchaeota archaeon]|nr:DUF131 domain-containing protein [Candidatus Woesearchaeota archaeon]